MNVKLFLEYKGALGDSICLTAFLPELKEKYSADIFIITSWPDVFKNNPYVSKVIQQPSWGKNSFIAHILRKSWPINNFFQYAKRRLYVNPKSKDRYIKISQRYMFENRHKHFMQTIAEQMEINYSGQLPIIYLTEQEINDAKKKYNPKGNDKYFVISPFAGWKARQWEIEHFMRVSDFLKEKGAKIYEAGGSTDTLKGLGENVVGKLTLRETAALIKNSRGYIGVDSGLAHLAVSLKVPSIILYGPILPNFRTHSKYSYAIEPSNACRGCSHFLDIGKNNPSRECPFGHRQCMRSIKPQRVIEIVETLL